MSFGLKSSFITNSCLTLGSLLLGHFLLFPQPDSPLNPQLTASVEAPFVRHNAEKLDATGGGRGLPDDDENATSSLLSQLPEGFYADLYVASKSYLEESDFSNETAENGASASPLHDPDTRSEPLNNCDTDSALLLAISSLRRQGGQVFGTNDFSAHVDVTAFFEGEREEPMDGDDSSGDDGSGEDGSGEDGSGEDGSGSTDGDDSSGSGSSSSGKGADDNSSNAQCSSGVGSGSIGSGSGQEYSGSGNFDRGSGQENSGSGSGDPRQKSKKSCQIQ